MGRRAFVVAVAIAMAWPRAAFVFGAERELIVSAAASLTNAFQEVAAAFEAANAGVRVTPNFAASGALLRQIDQGAPVDVFASADQETMDRAEQKGLLGPGTRGNFARNALVLVAPAASAVPVSGVEDLRQDRVGRIAVGDPSFVPAGRYARQALRSHSLWEALHPKLVFANSVRQVLDYVARGEVDAGIVYRSDAALRSDEVRVVQPLGGHDPVLYPVAAVRSSRHPELAGGFVAFLRSPEGQAILGRFGFQSP